MIKMGPFQWKTLALLSLTSILGLQTAEVKTGLKCEDGWSFFKNQCYLMRDESETFMHAFQTCGLFGAQLAYATSDDEMTYLYNLIGKQTLYGWWYGAQVSYQGKPLIWRWDQSYHGTPPPGMNVIVPKHKKMSAPTTSFVGLIHDHIMRPGAYFMIDVPPTITLPYVCRGDPSKVTLPKSDHVVQNNTRDVYWFSSMDDRRSYDDAKKACQAKSMTLLSVRGEKFMDVIMDELSRRQDDRVEPWWIGLQVKDGVYSWSSGIPMEGSIVKWNDDQGRYTYYEEPCRILLNGGTSDDKNCYSAKAPFICKKFQGSISSNFGCPDMWYRAGQSCYADLSKHGNTLVSYTKAENLCSKAGSHPVTIGTPTEKTWLLQSYIYADAQWGGFWTSLNDRKKRGAMVWPDGSAPQNSVVIWNDGDTLERYGDCFYIVPNENILSRSDCNAISVPGCQHPAKGSDDCLTKNWKYFNGNCYFFSEDYESYNTMLHKCYEDVLVKNSEIELSPLKVNDKKVVEFLAKNAPLKFESIWVGLKHKGHKIYTWSDGSKADISFFKTQSYVGTDNSTSKCAVMRKSGEFESVSCSTCQCGKVLCEMEKPVNNNNGNVMTSHFSMIILFLFCTILTVY